MNDNDWKKTARDSYHDQQQHYDYKHTNKTPANAKKDHTFEMQGHLSEQKDTRLTSPAVYNRTNSVFASFHLHATPMRPH